MNKKLAVCFACVDYSSYCYKMINTHLQDDCVPLYKELVTSSSLERYFLLDLLKYRGVIRAIFPLGSPGIQRSHIDNFHQIMMYKNKICHINGVLKKSPPSQTSYSQSYFVKHILFSLSLKSHPCCQRQ